ncbi:MAG: FprA family A-type flavoprotein [Clostridiales bacterium]|jgi:flavorubredoxin|nr:FprA family A-type flavoprotein [Clostridiales bacterium]
MEKRKAVEIKENIYWTGVLDYDITVFDIIMTTEHGTTYNSYIVKGNQKTALIEIAKESFFDEFIERVASVCDVASIDYIITNHTEPDHSGSLAKLLELNDKAIVVGSQTAMKFLKEIANREFPAQIVQDGDTLDLGGKTLQFISAPFLHWPDSMYTYLKEDKTLFSCDSFGCHYASDKLFNDAIEGDFIPAYQYYFDAIMGPFKSFVLQALDKIKTFDIDVICPGHGPILRTDLSKYTALYRQWATVVPPAKPSVAIPFVSAYGYTKMLAEKIAEGVRSAGDIDVFSFDLVTDDKAAAAEKIAVANGLLIGSPTLLGDTLPPIWSLLSELNPIIHKGKLAGAFGSYGWSGEAVGNIEARLKQLRFKMPLPGLKIVFKPNDADLARAFDFGVAFAQAVLASATKG